MPLKEVLWEKSYSERLEEYHLKNHQIPKLQLHQPMETPLTTNKMGVWWGIMGVGYMVPTLVGVTMGYMKPEEKQLEMTDLLEAVTKEKSISKLPCYSLFDKKPVLYLVKFHNFQF